jgi:hypothetical protein
VALVKEEVARDSGLFSGEVSDFEGPYLLVLRVVLWNTHDLLSEEYTINV